jgi:hypothetical protein
MECGCILASAIPTLSFAARLKHAPCTRTHLERTSHIELTAMSTNLPLPLRQSSLPPSARASTLTQTQYAPIRGSSTAMTTPPQGSGLRYPSNKKTIYDRNLNRSKNAELSRAAFAFLFIEMIGYAQKHVKDIATLEKRYGLPHGIPLSSGDSAPFPCRYKADLA